MCGITGIVALSDSGRDKLRSISSATKALYRRGPDGGGHYCHQNLCIGHRRLSIIDTTDAGSQPFTDETGRYTIVFNGEFFNFKEHKRILESEGHRFRSGSDTEVLLRLFIKKGESCLQDINGFFAFAIYDKEAEELFLARDRFGIKPLLIYQDESFLAFASEMKSLFEYGISKEIDFVSLHHFFHLNYIPGTQSIFKNVRKLSPGSWMKVSSKQIHEEIWYKIPYLPGNSSPVADYQTAQEVLIDKLDEAVRLRMISDVPLGAFLSGGIDSSVIVSLASRHTKHLNTFSIGFKDEALFDETYYANLVSKRYKTNHTNFQLSNQDLFAHLFDALDYLDEPFADSSALAVYILSRETRKNVTVALSGDGADEMFGGYIKHFGEWQIRNGGWKTNLIGLLHPLWSQMPQSRNSRLGNVMRKLNKFSSGLKMNTADRYWKWCGYADSSYLRNLERFQYDIEIEKKRRQMYTRFIDHSGDLNDVLLSDMHLVLPGDMLTKVDAMSMSNSLEVRVPFLDYHVVNYAFSLPEKFKINGSGGKMILRDAFRPFLPEELYTRPKHGFEVPLLKWFRKELNHYIFEELLEKDFIIDQGLFNPQAISQLREAINSKNPGDSIARIWALIVFQHWWRKWMI